MKNSTKNHYQKVIRLFFMCVFVLVVTTACGTDNTDEAVSEDEMNAAATENEPENEKSVEEQIEEEIAGMRSRYLYIEEEMFMSVSQPGNYIVDGVELCDAAEAPQEPDDTWEGYSEEELGFLKPDSMPNCTVDEKDCHFVVYDGVTYVYVNDYNFAFGERSSYTEYANVWCSADGSRVLGGLEEYGRKCAQELRFPFMP